MKVRVGDETFNLSYGAPMKRPMKPGSYEVVILDGDREVERSRIEIVKKDLMSALLDPEFYVYNIGEIHIYRRATLGYAASESDRTYSEQLFPFQHFFSQPEADYTFQDAPQEIKTQSSKETRDEFTIAKDHDYNTIATMKYNEGNLVEANRAVEKALAIDPCHVNAFRNRIALLTLEGPNPEAEEFARGFRDACDGAGVEAHRAYQDTMMELGRRETLVADYRSRQRREPSAEHDYLLARLLPDAQSLSFYRSALAKDPGFARARLALAYDLMGLERYEEALSEIETTLDASMLVQHAAPRILLSRGPEASEWRRPRGDRLLSEERLDVGDARFPLPRRPRVRKALMPGTRGKSLDCGNAQRFKKIRRFSAGSAPSAHKSLKTRPLAFRIPEWPATCTSGASRAPR